MNIDVFYVSSPMFFWRFKKDQRKVGKYLYSYLPVPLAHNHSITFKFLHLRVSKIVLSVAYEITRQLFDYQTTIWLPPLNVQRFCYLQSAMLLLCSPSAPHLNLCLVKHRMSLGMASILSMCLWLWRSTCYQKVLHGRFLLSLRASHGTL